MVRSSRGTRRAAGIAIAVAAALASSAFVCGDPSPKAGATGGGPAARETAPLPPIRHVFVILLENKSYEKTFGPGSPAPYLADTLVKRGALLTQYYGIGHYSLNNYLAIISGQAPTPETQADCAKFVDFVQTGTAPDGQVVGRGCVYPRSVRTLADQLMERKLTWKGYMEDMGNDPTREPKTCAHPPVGAVDPTEGAQKASGSHPLDQYATKHNPFMYFHSIIDSPACDSNVVPLPALEADLRSAATTPNFAFITPNLCNDGHDSPCVDGSPGGLVSANAWLRTWVPRILKSPAFRESGLLIVTFDEASSSDASACCNEQSGPNVKAAGVRGPGGGRIGAVLVSPFIRPGTVSNTPYNHYSLLRSIEDLFGLEHLGYAGQRGLVAFGADVYTNATASR
ncbi:MAG: phosphoesterase [Gemmatimonadaceae bacterium]|nr:phosphoesterase [Gemmatimonadaceae bacterium]